MLFTYVRTGPVVIALYSLKLAFIGRRKDDDDDDGLETPVEDPELGHASREAVKNARTSKRLNRDDEDFMEQVTREAQMHQMPGPGQDYMVEHHHAKTSSQDDRARVVDSQPKGTKSMERPRDGRRSSSEVRLTS